MVVLANLETPCNDEEKKKACGAPSGAMRYATIKS